jgi:hypothetical protein
MFSIAASGSARRIGHLDEEIGERPERYRGLMRRRWGFVALAVVAGLCSGIFAVASAGSATKIPVRTTHPMAGTPTRAATVIRAGLRPAPRDATVPPRPPAPVAERAVRQLAHGSLPGGQLFTIVGQRYRFAGRLYFSLNVAITRPDGGSAGFTPAQSPGVLAYTADVACTPHPYAVMFGLLRAPSDAVIAREGRSRTVLPHVSIPSVLHAHGVLVYASLTSYPSEMTVVRPDGKRVLDDKSPRTSRCLPGIVMILRPSPSSQPGSLSR